MTSQTKNTRYIAQAALIAAAYTVLTLLAAGFDLASGAIQVRFSEALTNRYLCALPPIISNALIIPFILSYAYHIPGGIPFFMLTVGAGEFLSCMVLGQLLISALLKVRGRIFAED